MRLPSGGVETFTLVVFLFAFRDKTSQTVARQHQQNYSNSTMILASLLKNYDRRIRPGARGAHYQERPSSIDICHSVLDFQAIFTGEPLEVRVDMFVSNIWAMSEVKMEFTIDLYLRQYWRDERLAYKGEGANPVLTLSSDINKELWLPSTYFLRAKLAYFHDVTTDNYLLQIRPDGSIFYSVRLTITVACNLDLRKFPHDTQSCSLALESYGYQTTDVWYSWNPREDNTSAIVVDSSVELPQFILIKVDKETVINKYNIGNHSSLIATFSLKRRIGYYLIDTYIPSTIIVVISWISFWIDPETASARVALGITTVLTMTTLISSARASLPKVSYVKAIDWYLLLCLIFVFGSILEYTFVTFTQTLHRRYKKRIAAQIESNGEAGNPTAKEQVTTDQESELVPKCTFRRNGSVRRAMADGMSEGEPLKPVKIQEPTWLLLRDPLIVDKVSRLGFPLVFMGFNCIYWLVYSS